MSGLLFKLELMYTLTNTSPDAISTSLGGIKWKELEQLQQQKIDMESSLNSGALSGDEMQRLCKDLPQLMALIDEKEMRWLELSEI